MLSKNCELVRDKKTPTKTVALVMAASVGLLISSGTAFAHQHTATYSISCKHGKYKLLKSVKVGEGGKISIGQSNSSPYSATEVHLNKIESGHNTTTKIMSDGNSKSWNHLSAGSYRIWVTRDTHENCNGWFPGYGAYSVDIEVNW